MPTKNFKARIGVETPLLASEGGTTAITLSSNDVTVEGDLTIGSGFIKLPTDGIFSSIAINSTDITLRRDTRVSGVLTINDGTINNQIIKGGSDITAIELNGANVIVAGDLTVTGNDIKSSSATALTLSGADVAVAGGLTITGDVTVTGNDIKSSGGTTALTLSGANAAVAGDLTVTGNDIKGSSTLTAITLSDANVIVAGDLRVTGNEIESSAGVTAITLSSTNVAIAGNLTVDGGNIITTDATAYIANSTTTTLNIGGAATTVSIGATTGTTTVNNSLVADDISVATVDTTNLEVTNIKAKDGTAAMIIADTTGVVTVSTELNVDNINISGNTIISTDTNGNIILDPNGTGDVVMTFANGGNITNNRNYVHGAIRNATTETTNGDIWELNSSGAQSATNPFFRGLSLDNSADTTRGPATLMRSYSGGAVSGSASRGRLIFEKARGTAASPTAVQAADILGSIDVTGYTSTGWLNDTVPAVTGFFGFNAAESWVSNTALGTSFSLSLAPTTTTINTGANLVQTLSINPQSFASRSDAFTWANGKTGTTQTMSLDVSGNLIVTGDVRVNGNDIQCSSGASTITMTSANAATTVRGDQINLQTAASVGVTGNKISYNRVFGQWQYDATLTPAAANTAYAVPFQGTNATIDFANIATAASTSQIAPNALGMYKLQFSAQVQNSDNGQDHQVTFWWRKNGTDISNSAGYLTIPKAGAASGALIVGWDNMVEVTTITDYYELMYAVSSTSVTLPFIAASAPRPGAAAVFLTLVPIGA